MAGIAPGLICDREVNLDEVLAVQSAVRWKREILGYRLMLMHNAGEQFPLKCIAPTGEKCSPDWKK